MGKEGEKQFDQNSKEVRNIWPQSDLLRLAMNWSEDDLDKLQILVDDAWGESHPCSVHLDELSEEVKIGVWENGGRPAQFHVTDICDGWAQGHEGMNYILPSRETMADMVEIHGSVIPWDGAVLLSASDKSVPAHLMAIARLDLAAVHVPGGSMRPGPDMQNTILGDVSTQVKEGKISKEEVRRKQLISATSCGACQFMGTASTMQCMAEALGMAIPGSAVAPATMSVIKRNARLAGKAVINLKRRGLKASDIMTEAAFENAVMVHAAIGGSTNALLHLPAIARELDINLELDIFDKYNKEIPHLAWVQPSGPFPSELFWYAGGVPLLQYYLQDYLNLDVLTITGKTLGENLKELEKRRYFSLYENYLNNYNVEKDKVINPPEKAETTGSIAILSGNLAPEGAVVKYSAVDKDMMQHIGLARVFDSEEECCDAITGGEIDPGDVLIIRYEGPRGSGMPENLMVGEAIMENKELANTTVLITDGRYSGGTRGPCIGHVEPEAMDGGPIAVVKDGDLIEVNIPGRKLNITGFDGEKKTPELVKKEIKNRLDKWEEPESPFKKGVLAKFTRKDQK
ncbi:MAG: dihydroxy-acid dehydratase [Bacillota bacterium]